MKKFAFLFPDQKHFDTMIEWGSYGWSNSLLNTKWGSLFDSAKTDEEKKSIRKNYIREQHSLFFSYFFDIFNQCIRERYRKNDFGINWITLDNEPMSSNLDVLPEDRIILSGVNFVWGDKKEKTLSGYPDFNYLVGKIGNCEHLRVGGHMIWDCVSKFAEAAHKNGLDVLVDEDLTDFFQSSIKKPLFKKDIYPSINLREWCTQNGMLDGFKELMIPRNKPWFYQDY